MLYDDWLDIPCASHSSDLLAPILERLVTRIPEGISTHKVMLQIIKSSCYDLISACFRTLRLSLGKPLIYVNEVVSPPTLTYIKINSTRSAKFIINICIDNRSFKVVINRKEERVGDLKCGNVGETNWLGRCCIWAWTWWGIYEITSMLTVVSLILKLQGWFFMNA